MRRVVTGSIETALTARYHSMLPFDRFLRPLSPEEARVKEVGALSFQGISTFPAHTILETCCKEGDSVIFPSRKVVGREWEQIEAALDKGCSIAGLVGAPPLPFLRRRGVFHHRLAHARSISQKALAQEAELWVFNGGRCCLKDDKGPFVYSRSLEDLRGRIHWKPPSDLPLHFDIFLISYGDPVRLAVKLEGIDNDFIKAFGLSSERLCLAGHIAQD